MKRTKKNSGAITLEAAMVVPMFIMLMLFINGIFILFMGQQIMSHTLIQSAKSLAFDPYATDRVADKSVNRLAEMFVDIFTFANGNHTSTDKWYEKDAADELDAVIKERYIAYLKDSESEAGDLLNELGVVNGVDGLDFSGSTIEDDVLTIRLKYTQEYIFNTMGLGTFDRELTVQVKLFKYKQ